MTLIWHRDAACRPGSGARPQDFSPEDARGRVRLADAVAVAQTWCAGCPAVDACLASALALRATGHGPQALVQAGVWFPAETAADQTPIDLLALAAEPVTGAAA